MTMSPADSQHGAIPQMELDTFIGGVDTIPPASKVLAKLSILISDENSTIYDIVTLVEYDASLTSVLLRISNSAFYASSQEVSSLEDAVNRLGFREVYRIATAVAARQLLDRSLTAYQTDSLELFSESLACAIISEYFSDLANEQTGSAYTFGLLHRVGKWIINDHIEHFRPGTIYDAAEETRTVDEWERALFGFDHARVGGALLKKWGFPAEVHMPVSYQIHPLFAPYLTHRASLLHVAIELSKFVVFQDTKPEKVSLPIKEAIFKDAQIKPKQLEEAVSICRPKFNDAMKMLAVG